MRLLSHPCQGGPENSESAESDENDFLALGEVGEDEKHIVVSRRRTCSCLPRRRFEF